MSRVYKVKQRHFFFYSSFSPLSAIFFTFDFVYRLQIYNRKGKLQLSLEKSDHLVNDSLFF